MSDVTFIKCSTPFCKNTILEKDDEFIDRNVVFCPECRKQHSLPVLKTQLEHGKPIKDVIIDSKIFKTANGMAAYVGVSFVTMYHWIEKYFYMSFQEFRRQHICNSDSCYLLNIRRSSYSRNDYILKKIRSRRYCACINALEPDHIMTNCPPDEVSKILRGYPKIVQISDSLFSLAPKPAHVFSIKPKHLELKPFIIKCKNKPRPIHFFER